MIMSKLLKKMFITILLLTCFNAKVKAITMDEFKNALKEVAFAYYRRGTYIQYNSSKTNATNSFFSPEEATSQHIDYMVCSAYPYNVYNELLGIITPHYTADSIKYARENIRKLPEVIAYGIKDNKNFIMTFKDKVIENPTIDDIIPYLKPGDVLTHTDHTIMIYDLKYNKEGKVVDAYTIEAGHGNGNYKVNTKINSKGNHQLYHNYRLNNDTKITEGSLKYSKFSEHSSWKDFNKKEYSILRFVDEKDGVAILNYDDDKNNGKEITLPQKTQDRLKYKKLFIEKTVDPYKNNYVKVGDTITYKIIIKNESSKTYSHDITVTEELSKYVTYKNYSIKKNNKTFGDATFNKSGNTLTFNIGKLASNDEVIITYSVVINKNDNGTEITSTGKVANIPTPIITNAVGQYLTSKQMSNIKDKYYELISSKKGKDLINEIYNKVLGINLYLKNFDITKLINKSSTNVTLNTSNVFRNIVLNKYYSALKSSTKNDQTEYDLINFGQYSNEKGELNKARRADTINEENFVTGDILIYTNKDDSTTKENGEYAYIYIEGEGFVGINEGANSKSKTDDRNAFNMKYYTDNKLTLYTNANENNINFLSFINYQTLLAKDYYVILRPSLAFTPTFKLKDLIKDDTKTLLKNITAKTQLKDLFDTTDNNNFIAIYNSSDKLLYSAGTNNTDILKTGDYVSFLDNNNQKVKYIISIKGDVNGDGLITPLDYVKVQNHIMKVKDKMITGNEYLDAADYDNNGKIVPLDYVKIKNYVMSH